MNIIRTKLKDCVIIEPKLFSDARGFFIETFQADRYANLANITLPFVQDNHSHSSKGVLRGLHFQKTKPQGKLVRVVHGNILDVAVDIRIGSPTFGQHHIVELSAENKKMFFVPEKTPKCLLIEVAVIAKMKRLCIFLRTVMTCLLKNIKLFQQLLLTLV